MNIKTKKENRKALLEHIRNPTRRTPKKITMNLPPSYQELLIQLAILGGTSKTNIVKAALDGLAEQYDGIVSL